MGKIVKSAYYVISHGEAYVVRQESELKWIRITGIKCKIISRQPLVVKVHARNVTEAVDIAEGIKEDE